MGSPDQIDIAHHHPGRLRLRSSAFCGKGEVTRKARKALLPIVGVTEVAHDERTGSLLIRYEPIRVEADALVGAIAQQTGLPVRLRKTLSATDRDRLAIHVIDAARGLDAMTFKVTGGRMGLGTVVPAALAGLSAFSLIKDRERRLPRWDNLLFWSYRIFTALHESEINARRHSEGA